MDIAKFSFASLQNGSDIRGTAMEGFGSEVNLTDEAVYYIGSGFACYLTKKTKKSAKQLTIAIGYDSRVSGPKLTNILARSLSNNGVKVAVVGLSSTPAMFKATNAHYGICDASIMVTASHLPMEKNGMKFFVNEYGLDKEDIKEILSIADDLTKSTITNKERQSAVDENLRQIKTSSWKDFATDASAFMDVYAKLIRRDIFKNYFGFYGKSLKEAGFHHGSNYTHPKILAGLKITVDAGNGAGGFFATKVLAPLGADVSSSQYLEPDGTFPNHVPNPEDKTAIASISSAVQKANSDLGIIFDTDVDRASAIGPNGQEINRNKMIALIASLIRMNSLYNTENATIVTDSVTSNQLTSFLEKELGFKHLRYKRGYKNVINKASSINLSGGNAPLAIETSGHGALRENSMLDDGAYLAALITAGQSFLMNEKGTNIENLISTLEEPLETAELRLKVHSNNFAQIGEKAIRHLQKAVESGLIQGASLVIPNYEGVRIAFDCKKAQGWALLRLSLHDPLLPLNIEASNTGGADYIRNTIQDILKDFPIDFNS